MIEDNLQINEDNSTLTHVDSTHDQLKIENDDEKLSVLNHSCAHLLAQAVK